MSEDRGRRQNVEGWRQGSEGRGQKKLGDRMYTHNHQVFETGNKNSGK